MRNRAFLYAAPLVGLALTVTAQAAPITGQLATTGTATFTSSTITPTGPGGIGLNTATGSYAPTFSPGCATCVTDAGFTYDVLGPITPVTVYSALLNGITASFTLNDVTSFSGPSGGFLNVSGTGFANLNGYDQTPGTFLFSSQGDGNLVETFSATSTAVAAPEPLTLSLLATGLVGLGLVRGKRSRRPPSAAA